MFIGEIGAASELTDVEVSTDFGETFTLLTQADGGTVTGIDFGEFGFSGDVNAVRITGLDDGGSSPGFDVDFVRGLEGSVMEELQGPSPIPLPASLPLFAAALGVFGMLRRLR